jgi:hypothetical protein
MLYSLPFLPFTIGKLHNMLYVSLSAGAPWNWLQVVAETCRSAEVNTGPICCINLVYVQANYLIKHLTTGYLFIFGDLVVSKVVEKFLEL